MKAYSVASRKGGVGKSSFNMWLTTLAFHLLYKQNIRICLIDMDDQSTASNAREKELANNKRLKSLSNFYPDDYKERLQNLYPVYSWTFEDYEKKFKKLKENFDIVFIDFAKRAITRIANNR